MSKPLTVADYLRAGLFHQAVDRLQDLVRAGDPTEPVDADAIRKEYEATRDRLRAEVPLEPFPAAVHVFVVGSPDGAR